RALLRFPRAKRLDRRRRDGAGAHASLHRWRYALPAPARHRPPGRPFFPFRHLDLVCFLLALGSRNLQHFQPVSGVLGQPQVLYARPQIMAHSLISLLLKARYILFSTVVILLVVLAWMGKRVTYEQSISSFFAEDDPDMLVYQKGAATFGDDN